MSGKIQKVCRKARGRKNITPGLNNNSHDLDQTYVDLKYERCYKIFKNTVCAQPLTYIIVLIKKDYLKKNTNAMLFSNWFRSNW